MLQRTIDSLENISIENKYKTIECRIKVAKLKVEIAYNNVDICGENLRIKEYIISNLQSFSDLQIIKRIEELIDNREVLKHKMSQIKMDMFKLKENYRTCKQNYLRIQRERLKFFDYLYFSSANSSTVTFGEIIPNTILVRGLIMIQVVISLVLFGGYVNKLFK